MNKKFLKLLNILLLSSLVLLVTWCAENEPLAPDSAAESIETTIEAGPAEGAQLSFNSTVTFNWDGTISPGAISTFTYLLTMGTDTLYINTSGQKSYSHSGLLTGSYAFSVYATGTYDEETFVDDSPAARNFSVGPADGDAPVVTILQAPKQNSYASTGSNVSFEWTATDPSTGGSIVSFQYAMEDQSVAVGDVSWSAATLAATQKSYANMTDGDWKFWVQATDVSGLSSTASLDFVIKPADILFAIEPALSTADLAYWHTNILRDFAYEDFEVSDAASFIAKLNSGQYSTVVWAWQTGYSAVLDSANFADVTAAGTVAEAVFNYEQGGGHLWVVSSELMWGLEDYGIDISGANTFNNRVLHTASYNEAGSNFQGATSVGLSSYANIIVDGNATFTWVDQTNPTADAEAIYGFTPTQVAIDAGFGNGEPCGVRYPTTGETKVVFLGFYFTDSNHLAACKTADAYAMATTIFTDFGENND